MLIIPLVLKPLETNCYIVQTGEGEAVCIDPASEPDKIISAAEEAGLTIKKILLTHGHFDHTGAANALREKYGAPVIVHSADKPLMFGKDSAMNSLSFFAPKMPFKECEPDDVYKFDPESGEAEITQGSVKFTVIETPGHTEGSVCIMCSDENGKGIMFSGDTLFKDSIGRSDVYSSSPQKMYASLKNLKDRDGDYIVYPGHGESTTLDLERRYNPFFA